MDNRGWRNTCGYLAAWLCLATSLFAQEPGGDVAVAEPRLADRVDVGAWCETHLDELVELYRHFHRTPELSFQEQQTAAKLATELRNVGAEVKTGVGGHGLVAVLENGPGPTLMLRTDLDALPVREQTGLIYASQVEAVNALGEQVGVMHACGHDIHITNLVGVARWMASHRDAWSGTLMMIGQPAEERGAGAKAMLDDGLFQRFPKPDYALAIHVDASKPTGTINFVGGFQQANVDSVDITVRGRGGHGAYPHTTIDPIVQAAQLVIALQTIVSREVDPTEPAVVTVGAIRGGTKHNVIDDECHLMLTVRSYSPSVREQLHEAIRHKANAIAKLSGGPDPVVEISEGTPSLYNDPELTRRLLPVFQQAIGADNVQAGKASMGGEDFSRYGLAGVPILMFRLGVVDSHRLRRFETLGQPAPSLHSPRFYPDAEDALNTSIQATTAAALHLLRKQ